MSQSSSNINSTRQLKASEIIKKSMSEIFMQGSFGSAYLFDKSITVSRVTISPDLKNASIYVLPFGSFDKEEFMQSIQKELPNLRKVLTKKINFKFSPKIKFVFDENFGQYSKIAALLES